MEIPQEILNGMKLLDKPAILELLSELRGKEIKDWRPLIDTSKLNMQFSSKCILGQLFKWYEDGLEIIGLPNDYNSDESREQAVNLGFALPYDSGQEEYEELTEQWKQALLEGRR